MPTCNRRRFIPAAIDCWIKQTYENRELVIVDDGEPIEDLLPNDKRIQYILCDKMLIGEKRNFANSFATGGIICHWDDDDYSAPDRIAYQVAMLEKSGKPITGFTGLYFWDAEKQIARRYRSGIKHRVCGTTLCYTKDIWQMHRFANVKIGEDNRFVDDAAPLVASSPEECYMVARIHDSHTSSKKNISGSVAKELLPAGFWENERLVGAL